MEEGVDELFSRHKDEIYVDLPDRIVEIGPGLGSNLKRYRPGTVVVAFEPNREMHQGLRARAAAHGIDLDLRARGAESMDLPDASEQMVVSTLTLCSVENRDTVLAEVRRVLAPGGRFLFLEHIAAEPGTSLARLQRVLRLPWAAVGDRCDLTADTHDAIDRAGFSSVTAEFTEKGSVLDPSRRVIHGVAVR